MDRATAERLLEGIHSRELVSGLTHDFYRYPARFSPLFARAAIEAFTEPGDVVLDPFAGGCTSLVEARVAGRIGVGIDINALSAFLGRAKTTILSETDGADLRAWGELLPDALNLRNPPRRAVEWMELGYQRNIGGKTTWPMRKLMELALDSMSALANVRQERIARTVILKTAQWALDCRSEIPTAAEFRLQLVAHLDEVLTGALAFRTEALRADHESGARDLPRTLCLTRSVQGVEDEPKLSEYPAPRLILTSPPYPGVHVLYHRWQVQGRRETPAPFWIADSLDGNGASHYTFGDREEPKLARYFRNARASFSSLAKIADRKTTVVQLVAFADPSWQLPEYLAVMREAGFEETFFDPLANGDDGRVWRGVPNRKWYARNRGEIGASKEVVLFHRIR
jgi:hypothetical protein